MNCLCSMNMNQCHGFTGFKQRQTGRRFVEVCEPTCRTVIDGKVKIQGTVWVGSCRGTFRRRCVTWPCVRYGCVRFRYLTSFFMTPANSWVSARPQFVLIKPTYSVCVSPVLVGLWWIILNKRKHRNMHIAAAALSPCEVFVLLLSSKQIRNWAHLVTAGSFLRPADWGAYNCTKWDVSAHWSLAPGGSVTELCGWRGRQNWTHVGSRLKNTF